MKTFDYQTAWQALALPAFQKLSPTVKALLDATHEAADNLSQVGDCTMPWPEDGGKLKGMFEAMDSESLSNAALVVNYYGHWRPGASIAGDAPKLEGGTHWKFSHYADQVLRSRYGHDSRHTVSRQIHEGTIRVCYSSNDMRTWHEVAPATDEGNKLAQEISASLTRKVATASATRRRRDDIAYKFIEELKSTVARPEWNTAHYMVEEAELEIRRVQRMPKPDKAALIADVKKDFDKDVEALTVERDGQLWLIENDIPTANAIYYKHTGKWCFGWRKTYTGEAREMILKALAKFPFVYDVK